MKNIVKANLYYWKKTIWLQLILMMIIIGYCVFVTQTVSETFGIDSWGQLYDVCRLNNIFILELFLLFFTSNNLVLISNNYLQNMVISTDRRWKVCFSMLIEGIIEISVVYFMVYLGVLITGMFITKIDLIGILGLDFFKLLIIKWLSLVEMSILVNATLFLTRRTLVLLACRMAILLYFVFAGSLFVEAKDKYVFLQYHIPLQYIMSYQETMNINSFVNILIRIILIVGAFIVTAVIFDRMDLVRMERKEY